MEFNFMELVGRLFFHAKSLGVFKNAGAFLLLKVGRLGFHNFTFVNRGRI